MNIYLVRHGETEWNILGKLQGREDIPLNTNGIEQIQETAIYLNKFKWNIIITSPLLRAKMSAKIISEKNDNANTIEEKDFMERDYGKASGMTVEDRKKYFPDGNWIGVETQENVQKRVVNALKKYTEKYQKKDFIIVSHGGAINSILAYLSKNEIGTGKTTLRNACITLLEKRNEEIKIVYYNKIVKELSK